MIERYKNYVTEHSFNPAEAREGFKRKELTRAKQNTSGFNPAEAREGFKS